MFPLLLVLHCFTLHCNSLMVPLQLLSSAAPPPQSLHPENPSCWSGVPWPLAFICRGDWWLLVSGSVLNKPTPVLMNVLSELMFLRRLLSLQSDCSAVGLLEAPGHTGRAGSSSSQAVSAHLRPLRSLEMLLIVVNIICLMTLLEDRRGFSFLWLFRHKGDIINTYRNLCPVVDCGRSRRLLGFSLYVGI